MWLKALRRLLKYFDTEKDAYLTRQLYVIVYKRLKDTDRLPKGEELRMYRLYQSTSPAEASNP